MSEYEKHKRGAIEPSKPLGRTYVHARCGGATQVSGGDFTHICDPFWPCSGTYCCTCAGVVSLADVCWADTGERISDYRRRLRKNTPGLLKAWRFGLGLLPGGVIGAALGFLVGQLAQVPLDKLRGFIIAGGIIGGLISYLLGSFILSRKYNIDYRTIF